MKKLMIAAAIICAAALSQAAAINWSTGNLVDHAGDVINKSTAYTATVYFFDAGGNDISESKFGDYLTASTSSKKGEYANTVEAPSAATGTYYAKVIVTDGTWTLESDIASFSFDADAISPLDIQFQSGTGLNKAVLNNSGTNFGWTTSAVPEPTSGLLLLLGVAGLALRRRRA